ncbi:MAG: PEP/pyruvate-binding domain-containing protein [Candidatus Kerfeldbacteria bacterium]|nr:hypothetical protein [Bacteroidota bacterium]
MSYTKQLEEITKESVSEAGGKGASLGEMMQAGFPVPPGFVITSSTYDEFLDRLNVKEDINAQLKTVDLNDMNSVEKATAVIHDIIHDVQIPDDMQKEFLAEFDKLDATFVAVRSSATAEDSAVASWAGELETYLNTTKITYINNIKKCWASLFSPRAIFYRMENKLEDAKVSVAVVVQKMVNSDVAGVIFTVHPVTKNDNQMIIEAGFGLGEMLVSGQITPDSYIVAKDSLTLIDSNISTQTSKMVRNESGINEIVKFSEEEGSKQKLTTDQIQQLAETAKKIEAHYGFPSDIEWAIEGSDIFITQSRPITTL